MEDDSANDRVKRAERGCARAAEQVFGTRELMPSGPVGESKSMVARNFSTFTCAKKQNPASFGYDEEGWVLERSVGGQDLEANAKLRHSTFFQAESAVILLEVRKGMKGEHTPETDFTTLGVYSFWNEQ